ncbi:MAG: PIG-L family deacetylase [Candidatus Omnitrophica bacterium]|nr:PIG-L family deacetylase [Candidatus Omnitrophota bacterium]
MLKNVYLRDPKKKEKKVLAKEKILVVAAHPDDEVLGCGAAISRLVQDGSEAYVLILGEGVTSRDNARDAEKRAKDIERLKDHSRRANKIMGVKEVFFCDFPDNRFDTIAFIDIVKAIEKIKNDTKSSVIFTHYEGDLNIDHQLTFKAVLTATRPLANEPVKEIYSFEVPSSTEWRYPYSFSPDVFLDISKTINVKLEAMGEYKDELRDDSHPRSISAIKLRAQDWGVKAGIGCAEVFKTIRVVR